MARGHSRSRSVSPRRRRSPSEFRSMTRSRSRSPSPSGDRGRPLRSKYARSSSSSSRDSSPRSKSQSVGRKTPSGSAIPTVDLTSRGLMRDDQASWRNPGASHKGNLLLDFNNPPPGFNNPPPPAPPQNPIPSVSQTQMGFPPSQNFGNEFQGDFPPYGSSYYSGNSGYPDTHQMNNFSALPGPNYPGQPMGGGSWSDYPPSMSGNGNSQPGFSHPLPTAMAGPTPPRISPATAMPPVADSTATKNAAVEQELVQQKKKLAVEREDYFRKRVGLTVELKAIRERVALLTAEGNTDSKLIEESEILQEELMGKIKSIDSVIDMLTHIIGDRDQIADILKEFASTLELPKKVEKKSDKQEKRRRSKSRTRSRSKSRSRSRTPKKKSKKNKQEKKSKSATPEAKVNVVHYDPELHWCATCNVFPRSAIEYLTHLHSDVHKVAVSGKKPKELPDEEFKPWRVHEPRELSPPSYKNAPSKRVPIRGVPFLIPSTAWYCTLCKTWIGDLELADRHLKGPKHASAYTTFVTQNPHWEVDWLRDRTRAYERNSEARAKVEEISKKLAGKGKFDKPQSMDISQLTEMLANARKQAAEANNKDSDNSSSSSSSSEESDDEERKKAKKKKGKEVKGKKKGEKRDSSDKEGKKRKKVKPSGERSEDKKETSGRRDKEQKERGNDRRERSDDRRERSDDRRERMDDRRDSDRYHRGGFRGRRPMRGRADWSNRRGSDRSRGEHRDREDDRASSDREESRSKNERKESDIPEPSFRSQEHDWGRVLPSPVKEKPKIVIGKRPGLAGQVSRDKFGFHRANVFERLDKEKPVDDLYGPLEPPKKD